MESVTLEVGSMQMTILNVEMGIGQHTEEAAVERLEEAEEWLFREKTAIEHTRQSP